MANRTIVASAPHIHGSLSTTRLMGDVIIALLPALAVSVYVYGWGVLAIAAVSIGCCVLFEALIQKFLVRGKQTVTNLSAVVTGLLLAMNLPANIPLWIVAVGALVAIGVAKMPFGGLGKNPFNPAIVARVFLLIAYPVQMTSFPTPTLEGFADVPQTKIMVFYPVDGVSKVQKLQKPHGRSRGILSRCQRPLGYECSGKIEYSRGDLLFCPGPLLPQRQGKGTDPLWL